jgi:hypothetical protein
MRWEDDERAHEAVAVIHNMGKGSVRGRTGLGPGNWVLAAANADNSKREARGGDAY